MPFLPEEGSGATDLLEFREFRDHARSQPERRACQGCSGSQGQTARAAQARARTFSRSEALRTRLTGSGRGVGSPACEPTYGSAYFSRDEKKKISPSGDRLASKTARPTSV